MAITVATLTGGPAFALWATKAIQFADDSKVQLIGEYDDVQAALWGKFKKIHKDLLVKCSGTPLYFDTAYNASLFPYIGAGAIGNFYGGGNAALNWNSANSDQLIMTNAVVTKMPDVFLGVEKPIFGSMEFTGIIQSGDDASNAAAYFTWNPAAGAWPAPRRSVALNTPAFGER